MPSVYEPPPKCSIISSMATVAVLFAAYAGLSVERICSETGIEPSLLMNPDGYLPESFFEKFFPLLAATSPGRNVALEFVRVAPFSYLGTPGRLLLRSPDLRAMLNLFSEHCVLIADRLTMKLAHIGPAETIFRAYQPLSDIDGGMSAEIGLGMGARIAQEYFGDDSVVRMQFFHKPTGPVSAYEEFFKIPVVFQAEYNALIFSSKALDRPSRAKWTEPREVLDVRLKGLGADTQGRDDRLAKIRHKAMRNALRGDYAVSGLAKDMGMSVSSLQRELRSFDTSAGKLIDDIRKVNASGLLADRRLSIDEVAEKLGFKSERGFRRACQRWFGKTPPKVRGSIL